jgi:hypothetical protein
MSMLKEFAVAVIAASLMSGPVLAQGNNTPAPQSQTQAPAAGAKPAVKTSKHVRHHRHHKQVGSLAAHKKLSAISKSKPMHTARVSSAKPAVRADQKL